MALITHDLLDGVQDKVQIAVKRLQHFEEFADGKGYFLAFSGGKDSQTIYHLAKEAGVKFDAHFNLTTVDPPEVLQFVREHYPDVALDKPEKTMWELIVENGMPPTMRARYCCKYLKENTGVGRTVVTGIRAQESSKRSKRKMFETCFRDGSKIYLHPIIDWSEADVWEYLNSREIPHCEIYDMGFKRIGCVMCPFLSPSNKLKCAVTWPKFVVAYHLAFAKMLDRHKDRGTTTMWKTPADVMNWWVYGNNTRRCDENQTSLGFMEDGNGTD